MVLNFMRSRSLDQGPISDVVEVVCTALLEQVCSCTVISTFALQCSRVPAQMLVAPVETPCNATLILPHQQSLIVKLRTTFASCLFIPPSPHFVYDNLFMGGEDELPL
jgi:hypothetical protein